VCIQIHMYTHVHMYMCTGIGFSFLLSYPFIPGCFTEALTFEISIYTNVHQIDHHDLHLQSLPAHLQLSSTSLLPPHPLVLPPYPPTHDSARVYAEVLLLCFALHFGLYLKN